MKLTFGPRNVLQFDDARIVFRNFAGKVTDYNKNGDREFSIVIPNEEIADALMNDKNQYGVGWNVKVRAPREEGETPFIHLPVRVKFSGRTRIYVVSGKARNLLREEDVHQLDYMDISRVDLDIRPYDDEGRFGPFRKAYLNEMVVYQNVSRFEQRWAEEECPEE